MSVIDKTLVLTENKDSKEDEKHRENLNKTGFWGKRAAGSLIIARSTGRVLMQKRSKEVLQGLTYGTIGGAVDEGATEEETVRKEIPEETGYIGPVEFIPAYRFEHESGFSYQNFIAVIDEEFDPVIGWEAESYEWSYHTNPPEPLHFGMQSLLKDEKTLEILDEIKRGAELRNKV